MADRRLDGATLREWAQTCVTDLIVHTDEINRLNVFPVADSDTGTNMLFTMRSAAAQVEALSDTVGVEEVLAALALGALNGARGNSGVILSQILRATSDVARSAPAHPDGRLDEIDPALFATMLRYAVELVVAAMGGEIVDGTIVSVLQAAAASAGECAAAGRDVGEVVEAAAEAAAVALDRTPQQLPVLAEAGVVDSGGRGLLVLLDALSKAIVGHSAVRAVYEPAEGCPAPVALVSAPAFEVMYIVVGCPVESVELLRQRLENLGDSVIVAAADTGLSVHVHTDDAGAAVEAALDLGTPRSIQISALHGAAPGQAAARWSRDRAVLAVVDGDGAHRLFTGEGAAVLRTQNTEPAVSAQDLVRAIVNTGAASVMVLPNGFVAAEELVAGCAAAIGWGVDVVPLPTRSMVQGLAALAVHDLSREPVDDGYSMAAAAGSTRFGSVREADEEALTWAGPCRRGDGLGIVGAEVLVVRHDVVAAGRGLIDLLLGVGGELVTVLLGAGVDPHTGVLLDEHLRRHHLGTELVCYVTGHRGDAVIIGVE